ncbi:unnamed protein product [Closterium sp. NIES-54]
MGGNRKKGAQKDIRSSNRVDPLTNLDLRVRSDPCTQLCRLTCGQDRRYDKTLESIQKNAGLGLKGGASYLADSAPETRLAGDASGVTEFVGGDVVDRPLTAVVDFLLTAPVDFSLTAPVDLSLTAVACAKAASLPPPAAAAAAPVEPLLMPQPLLLLVLLPLWFWCWCWCCCRCWCWCAPDGTAAVWCGQQGQWWDAIEQERHKTDSIGGAAAAVSAGAAGDTAGAAADGGLIQDASAYVVGLMVVTSGGMGPECGSEVGGG